MATDSGDVWYSMIRVGTQLRVRRLCGACNLLYKSFDPGEGSLRLDLDDLRNGATWILFAWWILEVSSQVCLLKRYYSRFHDRTLR